MTAKLNRRDFIRTAAITAGAAALAACQPAAAPTEVPQPTSAPEEKAAEPTTAPETTTECQMDWNPTFPETPKTYDPPIEMAVIWEPGAEYPEGSDRFDNPMYNRTLEHTGIEYTMHWEGYGETATSKFAADMAAGTLADQFNAAGLTLEQLIDEDLVADIKDIWEATASPLVKEKKQYPDFTGRRAHGGNPPCAATSSMASPSPGDPPTTSTTCASSAKTGLTSSA